MGAGRSTTEASLMNLVVLLADRAAGASCVCSYTQPDPQRPGRLRQLTPRCPKAIGAGHRCELQVEALAMECAGDDESLPNFVDRIHLFSLPAARLSTHCKHSGLVLASAAGISAWCGWFDLQRQAVAGTGETSAFRRYISTGMNAKGTRDARNSGNQIVNDQFCLLQTTSETIMYVRNSTP